MPKAYSFVVAGHGTAHFRWQSAITFAPSGYAFLPPGTKWKIHQQGRSLPSRFHWIRKAYEAVDGIDAPEAFVANEQDEPIVWMPDTERRWGTTHFVDPVDVAHDMHVNIVLTLEPGRWSFPSMHYRTLERLAFTCSRARRSIVLNDAWYEVEAGDFMWLRAFYRRPATPAPERFRYLLYVGTLTATPGWRACGGGESDLPDCAPDPHGSQAPSASRSKPRARTTYPINAGACERFPRPRPRRARRRPSAPAHL